MGAYGCSDVTIQHSEMMVSYDGIVYTVLLQNYPYSYRTVISALSIFNDKKCDHNDEAGVDQLHLCVFVSIDQKKPKKMQFLLHPSILEGEVNPNFN